MLCLDVRVLCVSGVLFFWSGSRCHPVRWYRDPFFLCIFPGEFLPVLMPWGRVLFLQGSSWVGRSGSSAAPWMGGRVVDATYLEVGVGKAHGVPWRDEGSRDGYPVGSDFRDFDRRCIAART